MSCHWDEEIECSFVVVKSLRRVWLFATPWTAAHQASLCSSISWNLLELLSIESVMPSSYVFSVVQSVIRVHLFATPWTAACQSSLFITISWRLLKRMSIESMMPSSQTFSVIPFSSCIQSFPTLGSFPISLLLTSGGQIIGASASALVLPMKFTVDFL